MEDNSSLQILTEMFQNKDWFDSVGTENNRLIVYVKFRNNETLNDIPDYIDGKQVLVHFAAYKNAKKENYNHIINLTPIEKELNICDLKGAFAILNKKYNPSIVENMFYDLHNEILLSSDKNSELGEIISKLYDEYGFDIIVSEIFS